MQAERAETRIRLWRIRELGFQQSWELVRLVQTFDEVGLGWKLDGLAEIDMGMAVLIGLNPRKRLKVVRSLQPADGNSEEILDGDG